MAGVTRLELATSGVTGQRSNQLSYTPLQIHKGRREIRITLSSRQFVWGKKSDPGHRRQGGGGGEPL